MSLLRRFFVQSPGHYIAAVVVAVVAGAHRYFMLPDEVGMRFAWYEILSVSGYVTILIGMLLTVAYLGAFDIFSYALTPGRAGGNRKYKNYADYSQQQAEKRAKGGYYFAPYYVVGVVVVLLSLLLA